MVIQVNETMMRVLMKENYVLWNYQQIVLEIHLRIKTNRHYFTNKYFIYRNTYKSRILSYD